MRRAVKAAALRVRRFWLRAWTPWRTFWFEPADPTPLGVMRVLFGGMLLYTHFVWGLGLESFFGPNGWQSESLVRAFQQDQFAWSFWWWVPAGLRSTVHLASLGVLALYLLGAFTPVVSWLAYFITVSYAYRAPMANYGLDQINGIAALYLAIGPSGSTLSVDRLWANWRTARSDLSAGRTRRLLPARPSARANLALRLLQVHLCIMYAFACLSKLQGEAWWNGQAIWQAVSNLEYQSRDVTWLAWYPWLVNLLTHATIVWEMTFWALVWKPLFRPFVLLVGVAIHVGIGAFMGMWTFGLAVTFAYVSFVPGDVLRPMIAAAAARTGVVLRRLGLEPSSAERVSLRSLWFAFGFDGRESLGGSVATTAAPLTTDTNLCVTKTGEQARVEEPVVRPLPTPSRLEPVPERAVGPRPRSTVVLVESRVDRQADIQRYMIGHGYDCIVANDLQHARSLLAVTDVDAMIVMGSCLPPEETAAFREALISGGPALPASVCFVNAAYGQVLSRFDSQGRHRVIHGSLRLRDLRQLIGDLIGLPARLGTATPAAMPSPPPPAPPTMRSGQGLKLEQKQSERTAGDDEPPEHRADLEIVFQTHRTPQ